MNIINSFCSGVEWLRSAVLDAGTQGLGLDANHDDIPIPDDASYLLQAIVPSSVRKAADVARMILDGDFVVMSEFFNDNEELLPPRATLECSAKGKLLRVLEKMSGAKTGKIQALVWSFLRPSDESKHEISFRGKRLGKIEKPSEGAFQIQALVLSFLTPTDVVKLTSDLPSGWGSHQIDDLLRNACIQVTDPRFTVIGEKVWRKCFGDGALKAQGLSFEPHPPQTQSLNALRALVQLVSVPVENKAGFTLMTLPEGLTLNKIIALAKAPQPGHKSGDIRYKHAPILTQYGDVPVKEGVVAISNGLLVGSRNKSVKEQSALVASYGCQMPGVAEAVALCLSTFVNSSTTEEDPVRLLSDDPWSFTRCSEQILYKGSSYHLVVGGFAPAGLLVDFDSHDLENDGVCALRKF